MTKLIPSVCPASPDQWDAIWSACKYSTYFHSREWAEVWSVYTSGFIQPTPRLVTFPDHQRALLPLSVVRRHKGLVTDYLSSPGGTFGGWIAGDRLTAEHADALYRLVTTRFGGLYWRLNPFDDLAIQKFGTYGEPDETHALSLDEGFDSIYRKWSQGNSSTARKVRRALREGVKTKLATGVQEWKEYYAVYQDSFRRWGETATMCYDWAIFNEMYERQSSHIKLWLAVYQGRIIAGCLCFYASKHVVYWHGAALDEWFNLRPVNLLIHDAIKHACEKGYSWFDFNTSSGLDGVKAFKRSFGAQALPCPVIKIETIWGKVVGAIARGVREVTP